MDDGCIQWSANPHVTRLAFSSTSPPMSPHHQTQLPPTLKSSSISSVVPYLIRKLNVWSPRISSLPIVWISGSAPRSEGEHSSVDVIDLPLLPNYHHDTTTMPNSPSGERDELLSFSHGVRRAGSSNEERTEKRLMMSGAQGIGLDSCNRTVVWI